MLRSDGPVPCGGHVPNSREVPPGRPSKLGLASRRVPRMTWHVVPSGRTATGAPSSSLTTCWQAWSDVPQGIPLRSVSSQHTGSW